MICLIYLKTIIKIGENDEINSKVDIVASNQERYTLELLDEKPNEKTLSKWKIKD